jgi:hypothetical protein
VLLVGGRPAGPGDGGDPAGGARFGAIVPLFGGAPLTGPGGAGVATGGAGTPDASIDTGGVAPGARTVGTEPFVNAGGSADAMIEEAGAGADPCDDAADARIDADAVIEAPAGSIGELDGAAGLPSRFIKRMKRWALSDRLRSLL